MNKGIIAIDLSLRATGVVVLNEEGKVIERKTITVDKSFDLWRDFKEVVMIVEKSLKELNIDSNKEYDVVVELSKASSVFPAMLGIFCTKLQFLFKVSRFYFVSAGKWRQKMFGKIHGMKSKELKQLAKNYAALTNDITDWTQDEMDAYGLGKYWYESF